MGYLKTTLKMDQYCDNLSLNYVLQQLFAGLDCAFDSLISKCQMISMDGVEMEVVEEAIALALVCDFRLDNVAGGTDLEIDGVGLQVLNH